MKAMKFRIPNREVSRKVQEKLFEMGYKWSDGGHTQYLSSSYIYAHSKGDIKFGNEEKRFLSSENEEIPWEVFLETTKTKNKKMKKAFHTFEFEGRKVTTSAVETKQGVSVGFAVCMPQDEFKDSLSRKISEGRALSSAKLDSYSLDEKLQGNYAVLKAIATSWERAIRSNPELIIKGFKK